MDWVNIISTVGFPIACTVAMFWQMNQQSERHREEMAKVIEALNNNTLAISRLETKMEEK